MNHLGEIVSPDPFCYHTDGDIIPLLTCGNPRLDYKALAKRARKVAISWYSGSSDFKPVLRHVRDLDQYLTRGTLTPQEYCEELAQLFP